MIEVTGVTGVTPLAVAALVVVVATRLVPPSARRSPDAHPSRNRPRHRGRLRRSTRRDSDPEAVASWVDELARRLRTGATAREALRTVTPDDPDLTGATAPLRRALDTGDTVESAVGRHLRDVGDPHLHIVGLVAVVVLHVRAPLAEPLDRVGAAIRRRAADRAERTAHTAQARASARVMTLLPLGVLALMSVTDEGVRSVLTTPAGLTCVAAGVALNAVGWAWMRRVIEAGR